MSEGKKGKNYADNLITLLYDRDGSGGGGSGGGGGGGDGDEGPSTSDVMNFYVNQAPDVRLGAAVVPDQTCPVSCR